MTDNNNPVEHFYLASFSIAIVMVTWSRDATIGRKTISGLNHVTSFANNIFNPLIFDMSLLHDKSSCYSQSNVKEEDMAGNFEVNFC